MPGRTERWGVWGAMSGPPTQRVPISLHSLRLSGING